MAIDPESRLVLAVVPGARTAESAEEFVDEVKKRTRGRPLDLVTTDEYPVHESALLNAYGEPVETTATGRVPRKMVADKLPPVGMNDATVEKRREKGRVVEILTRVVFGDDSGGAGGIGQIEGKSANQHVVRGASELDGPAP